MFTKEELEKNRYNISILCRMLTHDYYKVGRLIDTHKLSTLIEKVSKAHFEDIKFLPKSGLYLTKTNDLGFGYSSCLSPARLHELIELGKVSKDILIHFVYEYGNIFTYIDVNDIAINLLLTDDVYFIVKKETKEIYHAVIDKPTLPNLLYYRKDLEGFKTTLDKARTIKHFNRIDLRERSIDDII